VKPWTRNLRDLWRWSRYQATTAEDSRLRRHSTSCIELKSVWISLELEFFLRLTVSQPVRLGIGPPFGTLDLILSSDNYFIFRSKAPSLTRKRVCTLQCNHSLVRSLTPNHTLPPHLRLCSLFVASYDSQGLRWKYSNPPPHWVWISDGGIVFYSYELQCSVQLPIHQTYLQLHSCAPQCMDTVACLAEDERSIKIGIS
jgi:hypothetical protein